MQETGQYKVVFQLSSNDSAVHKVLIQQLHNLLNALNNVIIEVAINGPGIDFVYKGSVFADVIQELNRKDVTFLICNNTLNGLRITTEQLIDDIKVIPATVAHLVTRQYEGWAYIKAGF
ncbi:DsrE family protein [Solitalea canadensis]|nr:DsrE family protein [Solitalea canadensis]